MKSEIMSNNEEGMNDTKRHGYGMPGKSATHLVSKLMCSKFQYTDTPEVFEVFAAMPFFLPLTQIYQL